MLSRMTGWGMGVKGPVLGAGSGVGRRGEEGGGAGSGATKAEEVSGDGEVVRHGGGLRWRLHG